MILAEFSRSFVVNLIEVVGQGITYIAHFPRETELSSLSDHLFLWRTFKVLADVYNTRIHSAIIFECIDRHKP